MPNLTYFQAYLKSVFLCFGATINYHRVSTACTTLTPTTCYRHGSISIISTTTNV